jgi:hypothetical protein
MWPHRFRWPIIIGLCWVRAEEATLLIRETQMAYYALSRQDSGYGWIFREKRFGRESLKPSVAAQRRNGVHQERQKA